MSQKSSFTGFWVIAAIFGAMFLFWVIVIAFCVPSGRQLFPNSWEKLHHASASVAFLLGAGWAVYTWWHSEKLRRLREIPAMEMDMEFREHPLPNGTVLLEIRTTARNSGVIPIRVDLDRLTVAIEKRPTPHVDSLIEKRMSQHEVLNQRVETKDITELTLEPMTNTIFTEYYVAERGTLYAVRFSIPFEANEWIWERIQMHFVPAA